MLSAEAQAALGFAKAKATPHEVMHAILKAPADLLFFGGIGTYVRRVDAKPTTPSATAPMTRSASPAPTCAARWWARAPISA